MSFHLCMSNMCFTCLYQINSVNVNLAEELILSEQWPIRISRIIVPKYMQSKENSQNFPVVLYSTHIYLTAGQKYIYSQNLGWIQLLILALVICLFAFRSIRTSALQCTAGWEALKIMHPRSLCQMASYWLPPIESPGGRLESKQRG